MAQKINLITIGYAGKLLDSNSREYARMLTYARSLESYTIVVFTGRTTGLPDYLQAGNLTIIGTNTRTRIGAIFKAARIIKKHLKKNRQAEYLISAQDPFETSFVMRRIKRSNVKHHVQVHGDFYGNQWWQQQSFLNTVRAKYGLRVLRETRCVRVVSERIRTSLLELGVRDHRVTVLPIRSELEAFTPAASVPERPFHYIFVGRLEPEKNIPMLLDAFADVKLTLPNAKLSIVGDGSYRLALEEYAAERNILDSTEFLGWREDVPDLLQSAHVFVLPSHYEGHAMVLVEAMAAGLPVVTTDVGCAGERVHDQVEGQVVATEDTNGFRDAMLRFSEDEAWYQSARAAAIAAVASDREFTQEQYIEAWVAALLECY